ncbi:hypothetical protein NQ317_016106 [Molorchus minor]|uniref:Uncharacterized protein n=1 Tax=Molorchus minor TaxID=1323400 RepID=A0ABQ9ITZ7_9CUCU|nr:hypothetical protein NQ317_016106 [Molorchus minor]
MRAGPVLMFETGMQFVNQCSDIKSSVLIKTADKTNKYGYGYEITDKLVLYLQHTSRVRNVLEQSNDLPIKGVILTPWNYNFKISPSGKDPIPECSK